ncbi:DNA polymerase IV [hydrothermal vent metagenome]|uniref:DNA-directed DNA polymerase n=1 Tax=hydrothermal vent metagenome TaxID=652676 RepID=A0A3B1CR54_9ZZZZ
MGGHLGYGADHFIGNREKPPQTAPQPEAKAYLQARVADDMKVAKQPAMDGAHTIFNKFARFSRSDRVILHVDMDAFFVSVEEVLNPALKGRPVVVGGDPNGRGVVSAASYKAREYGIHSAMPIAQAKRLCPKAVFLRGSLSVYSRFSKRIMNILARFTPTFQPVSVDEAYLDLTGCLRTHQADPVTIAQRIHDAIQDEVGVPASVGIASNKMTAKIAANLAKPNGLLYVYPGLEANFLAPLPVGAMPGVGPVAADSLKKLGIRKIGDLTMFQPEALERALGKHGALLAARANGIDIRGVETADEVKSISRESTYQVDTDDPETITSTLSYLAESVGQKTRERRFTFRRVTLKLRYSGFETYTRSRTLATPSSNTKTIYRVARELMLGLMTKRSRVRLVGVGVSLLSGAARQIDMFGARADLAAERLSERMDSVKDRYGFESVLIARSYLHATKRKKRRIDQIPPTEFITNNAA